MSRAAARRTARSALGLALLSAACTIVAAFGVGTAAASPPPPLRWSAAERATLASMSIARLPAPPADPSNAVEARPEAVALGRRLFADTRLSANGQVACASCHDAQRQFQDGLPVGRGIGTGARRTMPIAGAAYSPWLFWDGRKDSLWSQALGPLEDPAEHGTNRVRAVRLLYTAYRAEAEALFGPLPLAGLPEDAGPLGTPAQRRAWAALAPAQRDAVDRGFANLGKAIAAYERRLVPGPSRFDRYVDALVAGDAAGQQALSPAEQRGLKLFVGKGQCASCHNGPLFSDQAFHNTGVPPRDPARPDRGRAPAVAAVQADPFNCLGPHSDAPAGACAELRFVAADDPALEGAFRTPGLRGIAQRAPYMHAGQFATLDAVVRHYVRAPAAAAGHSELGHHGRAPIRLDEAEIADLVAFLHALDAPVLERDAR